MEIDLQTIENDVVSLETFFKTWLHDPGTDREQLHLLLPTEGVSHFTAPRTSLSILSFLPLSCGPLTLTGPQICAVELPCCTFTNQESDRVWHSIVLESGCN